MDEEEAAEESSGGAGAIMINGVHSPAPGSNVKNEGAAKCPRRALAEENKGAPKDNQTGENRAEPMVPSPTEDTGQSAKRSTIEIDPEDSDRDGEVVGPDRSFYATWVMHKDYKVDVPASAYNAI